MVWVWNAVLYIVKTSRHAPVHRSVLDYGPAERVERRERSCFDTFLMLAQSFGNRHAYEANNHHGDEYGSGEAAERQSDPGKARRLPPEAEADAQDDERCVDGERQHQRLQLPRSRLGCGDHRPEFQG